MHADDLAKEPEIIKVLASFTNLSSAPRYKGSNIVNMNLIIALSFIKPRIIQLDVGKDKAHYRHIKFAPIYFVAGGR